MQKRLLVFLFHVITNMFICFFCYVVHLNCTKMFFTSLSTSDKYFSQTVTLYLKLFCESKLDNKT